MVVGVGVVVVVAAAAGMIAAMAAHVVVAKPVKPAISYHFVWTSYPVVRTAIAILFLAAEMLNIKGVERSTQAVEAP